MDTRSSNECGDDDQNLNMKIINEDKMETRNLKS